MPQIIPIKDKKNTSEISDMCHKAEEPIYITKLVISEYEDELRNKLIYYLIYR